MVKRQRHRHATTTAEGRRSSAAKAPKSSKLRVGDARDLRPKVHRKCHTCLGLSVRASARQRQPTKTRPSSLLSLQARLPNTSDATRPEAGTDGEVYAQVAGRDDELKTRKLAEL